MMYQAILISAFASLLTVMISASDVDSDHESLFQWCNSNRFLRHLDYIKTNYPTHYRYCTTKASTCEAFENLKTSTKKLFKLNHSKFFNFCQNRRVHRLRREDYDSTSKTIVLSVNVVVDSSTADFLYNLFGMKYQQFIERYVHELLDEAGRILSDGIPNRRVIYVAKDIVDIELPSMQGEQQNAQAVYNRWCESSYKMLSRHYPESDDETTDINIILSRRFTELTNHVGYTLKNGMCSGKWSCTIIQDDGPQLTPVVIAHETAHLMGLSHVEEVSECSHEANARSRKYYVMSQELHANIRDYRWSACMSRALMSIDEKFSCLQKSDAENQLLLNKKNSRQIDEDFCRYSPDVQCKLMFNNVDSQFCGSKKKRAMVCNRLYCTVPDRNGYTYGHHGNRVSHVCHSRAVGALEHTSCASGRGQCIDGRCVRK